LVKERIGPEGHGLGKGSFSMPDRGCIWIEAMRLSGAAYTAMGDGEKEGKGVMSMSRSGGSDW